MTITMTMSIFYKVNQFLTCFYKKSYGDCETMNIGIRIGLFEISWYRSKDCSVVPCILFSGKLYVFC